jgi:hypothetical protein
MNMVSISMEPSGTAHMGGRFQPHTLGPDDADTPPESAGSSGYQKLRNAVSSYCPMSVVTGELDRGDEQDHGQQRNQHQVRKRRYSAAS